MRWVIIFFKAHIIVDFGSGTITQKRLSNTTVSIEIWHPNNNGNLMFPKISKLNLSMKTKKITFHSSHKMFDAIFFRNRL